MEQMQTDRLNQFSKILPFLTLFKKETVRFMGVPLQTLGAPIITASLFLFVFGINLGNRISVVENFSYIQFVVPGLVLMGVVNNSFTNSSSSIFFSRYIGNIVDLLVTPLTPTQFILGYTLPAMLRGLMVGFAVMIISLFFTDLPWAFPFLGLGMAVMTSFLFAQLGIIAAIYSESFEVLSTYTNFLLLPLVYLGGMFYPISILPPIWGTLSQVNPLFYMIDGFRQSILGQGDEKLWVDFAVTGGIAIVLFAWAATLIHKGYRLRT